VAKTKFYGNRVRITDSGGADRVTITLTVGQGGGGTSIPCKGCYVCAQAGNTSVIVMNIGIAASSSLGMEIPKSSGGGGVFVPIDDVSNLHFYGATNGDVVDILYFT